MVFLFKKKYSKIFRDYFHIFFCFQYPSNTAKERSIAIEEGNFSERAMIAKLEEENGEMLREMELIKQQQVLFVFLLIKHFIITH